MVMILVCVLSVVAAGLLLVTTTRYHTTYQSASWQEAIVGAEAGVDLAMNELRKRILQSPNAAFSNNWTVTAPGGGVYPNFGHAFPASNQPYTLTAHSGEGNTTMQARVFIDVPGSDTVPRSNFAAISADANSSFISQLDNPNLRDPDGVDRSHWWYRIRALGIAGLSGPPLANLDRGDNALRRFSFFNDWRTGRAVGNPQTARMVEVIAQPQTNFRNALMADERIDLSDQDVLIDSYDSSKGQYNSSTNHGQMGNIATNGKLINAGHAVVNGSAMTNNGTINDGDKVTGQQSGTFYQELTPLTTTMLNPAWAGVPSGGTVTTDTAFTASTDATNPTTVRLDGINLPAGGSVVSINAPTGVPATTPSFIKIFVQGDIITTDDSFINVADGVNAIFYFTGNVNFRGAGIFNNSMIANRLVFNGIQPPANADGTFPARSINISTYQDFEGVVYAPNHDLNLALEAVPVSSTSSTGLIGTVVATLTPSQTKQINDLKKKLADKQNDVTRLQADYAKEQAKVPPDPKKVADKLAELQKKQAEVAQIQKQIDTLQGTNIPTSQAEDHALGYNGIYGGFIAKTIKVANKTHIHYDETLRNAGPVNHYEIVSWMEDNLSRDAVGGTEQFWWLK